MGSGEGFKGFPSISKGGFWKEGGGGEHKPKKKKRGGGGGGGGGSSRKKTKKKKKKERRREGRRRGESGDPRNLMSIGPSNWSRSISNFDTTFYSTPETNGWSPMEILMVGFL